MQLQHVPTLLLSMTSLAGWSSPSGNLYWGKRFDKTSEIVFVLMVDECDVRYLPCASGTWTQATQVGTQLWCSKV